MYDDTDTQMQVLYDEIPQTPIQPDPVEAPPVAQAEQAQPEEQKIVQSTGETVQQRQKRYTEEMQERNFLELRRLQEQKDRELEYMRREIEQLRNAQNKPQKEELDIAKDAFAEVHHVEKIVETRLREQEERYNKQLEAQRKQLEAQRQQEAERTLNLQYKDMYQVLTPENLRRLEMEEPEIAYSIASNPDTYSAKVAAYKQIKKLGISEDTYNAQRVQERLTQNAQRPKSPAALAPRQGSQALSAAPSTTGFAETITDDMAARYRKEMEDAIARM